MSLAVEEVEGEAARPTVGGGTKDGTTEDGATQR
jgi:hypothetical protein